MPAVLPNTTTTDNYPSINSSGGALVGIGSIFASGFFVVANAAVYGKYLHGVGGQKDESAEIYMPPGTYPLTGTDKDPIGGIMFRSAVAGEPAQVFGVLYFKDEAALLSSAEFTATIAPSGAVSGGGGGDMELIQDQLLTVNASSIVFSNIPQNYKHLKLIMDLRSTFAATADQLGVRLNGDATASYYWQRFYLSGGASNIAEAAGDIRWLVGWYAGAVSGGGVSGALEMLIPNYAANTFFKSFFCNSGFANIANQMITAMFSGTWRGAGAQSINQIELLVGSGGVWLAGSRASLYGIN